MSGSNISPLRGGIVCSMMVVKVVVVVVVVVAVVMVAAAVVMVAVAAMMEVVMELKSDFMLGDWSWSRFSVV